MPLRVDLMRTERLSIDGFMRTQRPDFMRFTDCLLTNAGT